MSNYLKLNFLGNSVTFEKINHHEFRNKPFVDSEVFLSRVQSFKLLTKGTDVKRVYNLKLCLKNIIHNFLPGDTLGILPRNNDEEVDKILNRLNIDHCREEVYELEILKTTKKNATLPKHIPRQGTLKDILMYYVDIRKPPKKLFLRALIPFTKNAEEIKLLENICSPKGSKEYSDLITEKAQTLLGLLNTFPSCSPPLEVILEHSFPLHPRYYSIASSPLQNDVLYITFFVVENSDGTKGVCTGWLEDNLKKNDTEREEIPIYFRKPNNFRIPVDLSTPLLMIATGTGIAPFVAFLDHLLLTKLNGNSEIGSASLFYGCRYADRDFLYQNELKEYLTRDVLTKMFVAFSRDTENKWYVQDEINKNGEFVYNVLCNKVIVYVCGDTRTVVKGVKDAIIQNLVAHGQLDESNAKNYLEEMIKKNRFIADCWS